jgi:hypothetical protein
VDGEIPLIQPFPKLSRSVRCLSLLHTQSVYYSNWSMSSMTLNRH